MAGEENKTVPLLDEINCDYTPPTTDVNFDISDSNYQAPLFNWVNFSFECGYVNAPNPLYYQAPLYERVSFRLEDGYNPPLAYQTDFSFWSKPDHGDEIFCAPDWIPQNGIGVKNNFAFVSRYSGWHKRSGTVNVDFGCFPKDTCIPDWKPEGTLDIYFIKCGDSLGRDNSPSNAIKIDFGCCDIPEPTCDPDWTETDGLSVNLNFEPCERDPDWRRTDGLNVNLDFNCCEVVPVVCDPDWVNQPGNNVVIDIDSCDGEEDFVSQPGNNVVIDITCCDEEPPAEEILVSGNIRLDDIICEGQVEVLPYFTVTGITNALSIKVDGEIIYEQERATVFGSITLPAIVTTAGAVDRGNRINATNLVLPAVVAYGEVLALPEAYSIGGAITLGITTTSSISTFPDIRFSGDIKLEMQTVGTLMAAVVLEGINNPIDGLKLEGVVDTTLVTVQPSNLVLDPIILQGEATYNLVPTGSGAITLALTMQGNAAYIELPTIWGDITLPISMESQSDPVQPGNHIYWANLRLSIKIDSEILTPIFVNESGLNLGEITTQSEMVVGMVGSLTNTYVGDIIFNRGWLEFGNPLPPELREIYEASNLRSSDIKTYPLDARYPIYVPTTDYTIQNVELRRGTLEYVLDFNFDAEQVEKVNVWIIDENGNSVQDTMTDRVNGDSVPHVIKIPFTNFYSARIPVHCVNDKKYQFYLEVVYEDTVYDGMVMLPRKSHFVPFQAHFDNRNPFANLTDRISSIDANFANNPGNMFETTTTEFISNSYVFEDTQNVAFGVGFDTDLQNQFLELIRTDYSFQDPISLSNFVQPDVYFESKYFNLDIGQIGG